MAFSRLALASLVVMNLLPLAGVVLLDWTVYEVMLLYWLENGVLGGFTLLRMATAGERPWATFALGPFFVFHYGMFWVVHGTFVVALFGPGGGVFAPTQVVPSGGATLPVPLPIVGEVPWVPAAGWALLGLVVSHGVSYLQNWWIAGEREGRDPGSLMQTAYGRVVVLHIALLAGGFATTALGAPTLALVALVLLKIGFDVAAHLREHRIARQPDTHAPRSDLAARG